MQGTIYVQYCSWRKFESVQVLKLRDYRRTKLKTVHMVATTTVVSAATVYTRVVLLSRQQVDTHCTVGSLKDNLNVLHLLDSMIESWHALLCTERK